MTIPRPREPRRLPRTDEGDGGRPARAGSSRGYCNPTRRASFGGLPPRRGRTPPRVRPPQDRTDHGTCRRSHSGTDRQSQRKVAEGHTESGPDAGPKGDPCPELGGLPPRWSRRGPTYGRRSGPSHQTRSRDVRRWSAGQVGFTSLRGEACVVRWPDGSGRSLVRVSAGVADDPLATRQSGAPEERSARRPGAGVP